MNWIQNKPVDIRKAASDVVTAFIKLYRFPQTSTVRKLFSCETYSHGNRIVKLDVLALAHTTELQKLSKIFRFFIWK